MRRNLQVACSNSIEGDWKFLFGWEDPSVATSLHRLFLVHFLQFLRTHALHLVLANTNATVLEIFQKHLAPFRLKAALGQESFDRLIAPTTQTSQVSQDGPKNELY